MAVIRCKAKDPANCRYHSPDASAKARENLHAAQAEFIGAMLLPERDKALKKVNMCQEVYDATDDGIQQLKDQLRFYRSDGSWEMVTELTARYMKARMARAQETQEGATTDVQFIGPEVMSSKLNDIKKTISEGGSDRFYDIYDDYDRQLRDIQFEKDSVAFANTFNRLVSALRRESDSVQWFRPEQKKAFDEALDKAEITGRIHRSRIGLENMHDSMVYEVKPPM